MRPLACLAVFVLCLATAAPAWSDGAPVARIAPGPDAAVEAVGGVGLSSAVLPRLTVQAPTSITFGFQGPAVRITPPVVVAPAAFRGFGGHAARVQVQPVGIERPLVAVGTSAGSCGGSCCNDECGDLEVDCCGRVFETHRPAEVTHRSSYYVPTYRRYVGTSCADDCAGDCAETCEPVTRRRVVRRVVRRYVVRRPCYTSCYTPCYDPCYSSCYSSCYAPCYRPAYRSCGWGPFLGGFGWGLGLGVGLGWAGGCW